MLFDSTLRRDLSRAFGATLVVLVTIVITMMLMRTLGQAAGGVVDPRDVMLLLGYATLGYMPTILSLALFTTIVATLTRMYRDSEMVIWFASGLGLARFVRPVLGMSWPVLLIVLLLALFVWPWVNQRVAELKYRYETRSDLSRVAAGQFQSSADGRRVFFIERDPEDLRIGRNVFVLIRKGDTESVTSAREGRVDFEGDQRVVRLERGQRNEDNLDTGEKTMARFDSYQAIVGDRIGGPLDKLPPTTRSTRELLRDPTRPNLGEFAWRLGLVFGAINLALLAVGLSATNPRRPGSLNLLLALLTFIVYFNLINLSQAWIANGKASLAGMLVAVHGGIFVLALALIHWRDHAHTSPLFAPRARSAA